MGEKKKRWRELGAVERNRVREKKLRRGGDEAALNKGIIREILFVRLAVRQDLRF